MQSLNYTVIFLMHCVSALVVANPLSPRLVIWCIGWDCQPNAITQVTYQPVARGTWKTFVNPLESEQKCPWITFPLFSLPTLDQAALYWCYWSSLLLFKGKGVSCAGQEVTNTEQSLGSSLSSLCGFYENRLLGFQIICLSDGDESLNCAWSVV